MTEVLQIALTDTDLRLIGDGIVVDCFASLAEKQVLVRMVKANAAKKTTKKKPPSKEELAAMDRWIADENIDHGHGYSLYQSSHEGRQDYGVLGRLKRRLGKKAYEELYAKRQKSRKRR